MNQTRTIADTTSIGLSALCIVHCLALPVLATVVPSVLALPLADEAFHLWLVCAVIPISAYALTMGCKQHGRHRVWILGVVGIAILVAAALGGEALGETLERGFTVLGASIVAAGHYWNYRLCRTDNCDDCHTET